MMTMKKYGIQSGKKNYSNLFFINYIDNKNDIYTSEFLKKVDVNWNAFYEKKDYKTEKEEDKKEEDEKDDD